MQSSEAFARNKNFPTRTFVFNDSPDGQDFAIPDAAGIDMAARPGAGPAEPGEFDRVRGDPPGGEIFGQKFPAGGMGAETVDEEKDDLRIRNIPTPEENVGSDEIGHERIIPDGPLLANPALTVPKRRC